MKNRSLANNVHLMNEYLRLHQMMYSKMKYGKDCNRCHEQTIHHLHGLKKALLMGCQPDKLPASLVTPNKTHWSFAFVIGDFILC